MKDYEKDIPETTKVIQIDIAGNVTKKRFLGEFVCRIQNIQDQINSAKHEAMLNGDFPMYLPQGVLKANKMLSYLKYSLNEPYPKFWIDSELGIKLRDLNVIEEVYNKVMEFEEEWMTKLWGKDEQSTEQK